MTQEIQCPICEELLAARSEQKDMLNSTSTLMMECPDHGTFAIMYDHTDSHYTFDVVEEELGDDE